MTIAGIPTDGINLAVLNEALVPYATQIALNAGLAGKLNTSGGAVSGLLSFSGVDTPGLRLKSLTTAQISTLDGASALPVGSILRDSTTDRIDARLNRGTVELLDSAGGQTISGTLQVDTSIRSPLFWNGTGQNTTINGAGGSLFLQTGGVNRWQINSNHWVPVTTNTLDLGSTTQRVRDLYTGGINATGSVVTGEGAAATPSLQLGSTATGFCISAGGTSRIGVVHAGSVLAQFATTDIRISNGMMFSASNSGTATGGSVDVSLSRLSVNTWQMGNGGVNANGNLSLNNINLGGSLVFPELVTNGDFSVGTGWTLGTGWSISGGTAVATGVSGFADIQQNLPAIEYGRTYVVRFTFTRTAGTGLQVYIGNSGSANAAVGGLITANGTYTFLFHKNESDAARTLLFRGAADFTGTLDNVSVRRAF